MMNLKKEYYEFGPWLTAITDEEDLTHQFSSLKDVILSSNVAYKIPVDKEWREVSEGELLYDQVITMDDHSIVCYRVIDGAAYSSAIRFGDILYIRIIEKMLSCDIEIGTAEERLHFMYVPMPHEQSEQLLQLAQECFVKNNTGIHMNHIKVGDVTLHYKDDYEFTENNMKELLAMAK